MPEDQEAQANPAPIQDNSKEYNFERLRRSKEASDAQVRELSQTVEALKQQINHMAPRQDNSNDPYSYYGLERGGILETEKMVEILQKQEKILEEKIDRRTRANLEKFDKENYQEKIRTQYPDFDQVINEKTVAKLEEDDPEFAQSLSEIPDPYKRAKLAYTKIKKNQSQEQQRVSAQELVKQTRSSAYHYAPGGNDSVPDSIDLRSFVNDPEAKRKAYEKLKAAQKRGLPR